jgi:hypothetical protein
MTGFFAKAPVSERRLDITACVNARWPRGEMLGTGRRRYWQGFADACKLAPCGNIQRR